MAAESPAVAEEVDFVAPDTPIDLTNCEREPIHTPGAIQPHGALLVLREPDLLIVQASENAEERLGIPADQLLGTYLAEHLGEAQAAEVVAPLRRGASRAYDSITVTLGGAAGGARLFDGAVHRSDGVIILELEPRVGPAALSYADFYALVRETMQHVEQATTLVGLAQAIAEQMREITGFDRVWVYRFHEDWHGEIIAEARDEEIETWLGMHYPASDIPAQARALFLKHWLRMIPDLGFTPVPLVPRLNPVTEQPLDMGSTVLRGVSPIHVQYLQNMGVRASLVVSLIRGGKLWGLISGHHYAGPKYVPYATRTLCEFLAQAFSTQLGMAVTVEDRERALSVRAVQARLLERMAHDESFVRALTANSPTLLDLVGATGGAVCVAGDVVTVGRTPPRAWIEGLIAWLARRPEPVFATSALPAHYPPAREQQGVASGVLAAHVSASRPDYLLWFRPENRQTVKWAGDPRKPVELLAGGEARLHPRGSFELWEETVRGTSAPWGGVELEAAAELRGTIIDVLLRRADRIAELNAELEVANEQLQESAAELEVQAEELAAQTDELLRERDERELALEREREARAEAQSANKAKSDFLAVMSHELRTPLNAIGGYAQLLELGLRGAITAEQRADLARIQTNQRHLLGLINSILSYARIEAGQLQLAVTDVPLAPVLGAVEALVGPQLAAKGIAFDWSVCGAAGDPLLVARADEEKLRQVLLNLLSNAVKFTAPGGRIVIACRTNPDPDGGTVEVEVRDTGRGIAPDRLASVFEPFVQVDRHLTDIAHQGVGLGLAISRDLARRMGGDLSATSEVGVGSTFRLTLPRAAVGAAV